MMNKEIANVEPLDDYLLLLTYNNGARRHFDVKPFLDLGIFKELKDVNVFNSVRKSFDTIEWSNEADLAPEVLYSNSIKIN